MWQCHTYSQPMAITLFAWLKAPFTGLKVVMAGSLPAGLVGSSKRMLSGTGKRSLWAVGLKATKSISSGFMRTVSFQPFSLRRGARSVPSNAINELNVIQMEVNDMAVHTVVNDFPNPGAVAQHANRLSGYVR